MDKREKYIEDLVKVLNISPMETIRAFRDVFGILRVKDLVDRINNMLPEESQI